MNNKMKPIAKQYAAQVSQLKQLKPTPEMVEEFKKRLDRFYL